MARRERDRERDGGCRCDDFCGIGLQAKWHLFGEIDWWCIPQEGERVRVVGDDDERSLAWVEGGLRLGRRNWGLGVRVRWFLRIVVVASVGGRIRSDGVGGIVDVVDGYQSGCAGEEAGDEFGGCHWVLWLFFQRVQLELWGSEMKRKRGVRERERGREEEDLARGI